MAEFPMVLRWSGYEPRCWSPQEYLAVAILERADDVGAVLGENLDGAAHRRRQGMFAGANFLASPFDAHPASKGKTQTAATTERGANFKILIVTSPRQPCSIFHPGGVKQVQDDPNLNGPFIGGSGWEFRAPRGRPSRPPRFPASGASPGPGEALCGAARRLARFRQISSATRCLPQISGPRRQAPLGLPA